MDKSLHIDISVLAGIIKYGAVRAKESSEHDGGSDSKPSLNLSLFDCLVAAVKEALRLLASIGGTVVGGLLPDVLEPPSTPNHRSLMHSFAAGGMATAIIKRLDHARKSTESGLISQLFSDFLTSLPVGYLAHLACDATTKKGLPLIF